MRTARPLVRPLPNRRRPARPGHVRRRPRAAGLATAAALALGLTAALPSAAGAVTFTASSVQLPGSGIGTESGLGLGDFDGDGRTDVAAGVFSGQLSILLRDGAGAYAHATGSPHVLSTTYLGMLKVADLDGDGRADVIALRQTPSGYDAAVLLGAGDGNFGPVRSVALPGSAVAFALGDMNGDATLDLVVASDTSSGPRVGVLLGAGDGTFGAALPSLVTPDGTYPSAVALGDFDRDGKLDAAIAHVWTGGTGIVTVLRGDGAGGFARSPGSPHDVGGGTLALSVGDVNGDGALDLASPISSAGSDSRSATTGVLLGDGAGGFAAGPAGSFATAPETNATSAFALPFGDLDGDGRLDTALALSASGLWPLLGDGAGRFGVLPGAPLTAGSNLTAAAIGDLDGDGRADLLATSSSAPVRLRLFVNDSEPAIAVAPAADLGTVQVGAVAGSAVVTISNPGDHGLRVSGLAVSGTAAGDFAAAGCTAAPIPAGGSCDVTVSFAPTAAGARAATLEIASDAPGAAVTTVALSGTGTAPPPGDGNGGADGGGDGGGGNGGGGSGGGGSGGGSGGGGGNGGPGGPGATRAAALRVTVRPARPVLAPGRRARITVTVANRGARAAGGVTLCPRPGARTLTAGRCLRLGRLAPGKSARRTIALTLARRARRGSRQRLSLVARGTGARAVTVRVVVTAKR